MALNLQQQIEAVVDKATADATILHTIVHGDAQTDVITEGGPVKTVAKAIKGVQDDLAASRTELTQQVTVATTQAGNAAQSATLASTKAADASATLTRVIDEANKATSATVIPTKTWTGTGVLTDFTLDYPVGHPGALQITVAGVLQTPFVSYTLANSTTVRFSSAPTNGVEITARMLDKESQTGAALDGLGQQNEWTSSRE